MSTYSVRLSEWYPAKSEKGKLVAEILKMSNCCKCGKVPTFEDAIGNHALPFGRGGEVYCSLACWDAKDVDCGEKK